jgi:protoheme IX farnesyltransferase
MSITIPRRLRRAPRLSSAVAATLLGVYLLLVLGATNAIADAAAACPEWPLCVDHGLTDPAVAVALAHRAAALVVALLLLGSTIAAWRVVADRRVRLALSAGLVLFPGQIALGAVATLTGASRGVTALHLTFGVAIFAAVLVALAVQLEAERPDDAAEPLGVPTEAGEETSEAGDRSEVTGTANAGPGAQPTGYHWWIDRARAYVSMTKPKLMWLLCLVAVASMGLAAGGRPPTGPAVGTILGGVLAIGASGTFNNVLERDVDRKMARTADRPVVVGEVPVRNATAFGLLLTVLSLGTFLVLTNALAAALGMLAILYYTVVYTQLLKPNTAQNTVVGGAVGAFPALIGWAAVTGRVGVAALALGGVIVLWTPAHFYNLALAYVEDYSRAGFPMLPVVRGPVVTRRHVLWYLGGTLLATASLAVITPLDWLLAATAFSVGAVFLWAVVRLHRERTRSAAFRAFHASNAYLGAVLLAVFLDAVVI